MYKIAIIGSGVSGLFSSYLLSEKYKITMYEKNNYLGGHAKTIHIKVDNKQIPIDCGFMVFNEKTYPNFSKFLNHFMVKTYTSNMSFSVRDEQRKIEWAGNNFFTLFSQWKNLLSYDFIKMLLEIIKFNLISKKNVKEKNLNCTVLEFLDRYQFSEYVRSLYILPMAGSIWSCPIHKILEFPAHSMLSFFENHGLLDLYNRPKWFSIDGGSQNYIKHIARLIDSIKLSTKVVSVDRRGSKIKITDSKGKIEFFDKIVFSCNSDDSIKILDHPTRIEERILKSVKNTRNEIYVHTDPSFMPKNQKTWASWNYLRDGKENSNQITLTYYLNFLQNLHTSKNIFITLNPPKYIKHDKILSYISFDHPVLDKKANNAQQDIDLINGFGNTFYCGAWTGYGFHEDGVRSAVKIAKLLDCKIPWDS